MARGISNSNWMGGLRVVLQKGQMPLYCAARAAFSRNLWRAALLALLSAASNPSFAQSITPAPQNQPVISKSPQGQKDEAARAAARSPAHHFDRVLIIVLELAGPPACPSERCFHSVIRAVDSPRAAEPTRHLEVSPRPKGRSGARRFVLLALGRLQDD